MSNPVVVGVAGAVGTMLAGAGGYALGELHQLRDRLEIQQHTIDLLTQCAGGRPSPEQRRAQFTLIQGKVRLGLLAAATDWGSRHARSLPAAALGAAAALLAALVLLAYPHRAPAPALAAPRPRPVPAGAPPSAPRSSAPAAPSRPAPSHTPRAASPARVRTPAASPAPPALAFAAASTASAPTAAPAATTPTPEMVAASSASPAPGAGSRAAHCPRLLRIVLCR